MHVYLNKEIICVLIPVVETVCEPVPGFVCLKFLLGFQVKKLKNVSCAWVFDTMQS